MLQTHPTCKLQNSAFYIINSNKEASNANSSGSLNQYRELKSPHGSKYHQIPERTGAFYTNKSPSPQRGFSSSNFFGGDGRSRQSRTRPNDLKRVAETKTCQSSVSVDMQNSNFSDGTKPIITQGCPKCKSEYGVFGEGKGPHYASLYCGCCGRFIKWMPKPRIKQNDSAQLNNGGIR